MEVHSLLRILKGDTFVQRHSPYLSIADVGSVIRPLIEEGEKQTISTWIFNLQGVNRFVRNQHFNVDEGRADLDLDKEHVRFGLEKGVIDDIRRFILDVDNELRGDVLANILFRITNNRSHKEIFQIFLGLSETISTEVATLNDPFAEAVVLSVFSSAVLPLATNCPEGLAVLRTFYDKLMVCTLRAAKLVRAAIDSYKYALVVEGALSELYLFPIRLTKLLGFLGLTLLDATGPVHDSIDVVQLIRDLLAIYGNSIVALSEEQASSVLVIIVGLKRHGYVDLAEEIACRLYADVIASGGKVIRYFIDGKPALKGVSNRYEIMSPFDASLFARPSDLLTVIITVCSLLRLDEAIDHSLILIDHSPMNHFIPDSAIELCRPTNLRGNNYNLTIGVDAWRAADFRREWTHTISPIIPSLQHINEIVENVIYASALVLTDRTPWELCQKI